MDFVKTVTRAKLLKPPLFEEEAQIIEYRKDPLTGASCRLNAARMTRLADVPPSPDISEITGKQPGCAFCPENLEQATPLFPPDLCPEGRISLGECCLFPNLFPLARYHATATLAWEHSLGLDQFETRMVIDSLRVTKRYLKAVHSHSKEVCYPIYLWNHLPPSAASMLHPHVQVLADASPSPYQRRLLDRSREYYAETGRSFWHDLVEEEKRIGERYIGTRNSVAAIASFAPQGNREISLVCSETSNVMDLTEQQIADFAECLVKLVRGYGQMGVNSFNLSTFSGPLSESLDYYALHAKLISRPVFRPFYRSDTGILERFHYEADIEVQPEVIAETMRAAFGG